MKMCSIVIDSEHMFFIDFIPPIGTTIKHDVMGRTFKVVDVVALMKHDTLGPGLSCFVSAMVEELP